MPDATDVAVLAAAGAEESVFIPQERNNSGPAAEKNLSFQCGSKVIVLVAAVARVGRSGVSYLSFPSTGSYQGLIRPTPIPFLRSTQ